MNQQHWARAYNIDGKVCYWPNKVPFAMAKTRGVPWDWVVGLDFL